MPRLVKIITSSLLPGKNIQKGQLAGKKLLDSSGQDDKIGRILLGKLTYEDRGNR